MPAPPSLRPLFRPCRRGRPSSAVPAGGVEGVSLEKPWFQRGEAHGPRGRRGRRGARAHLPTATASCAHRARRRSAEPSGTRARRPRWFGPAAGRDQRSGADIMRAWVWIPRTQLTRRRTTSARVAGEALRRAPGGPPSAGPTGAHLVRVSPALTAGASSGLGPACRPSRSAPSRSLCETGGPAIACLAGFSRSMRDRVHLVAFC